MTKVQARGEKGIALALALAFMALAVPLVTAALGLASTLSIDSGVKTRIAQSQYSALGGSQHALYRLLYEVGYVDSLAVGVPDSYNITLNGKQITITVEKFSNPPSNLPPPAADNSRRLQTFKVVTPTTASPYTPMTFTYTITVENRDDQPENLRKVHDELPAGFSYVAGSTTGVTSSNPSISGQRLTWDLAPLDIVLQPGQSTTLTFAAQTNVPAGNYCNEAWVEPGDRKTSTGKTAQVKVGSPPNDLCHGAAAELTKMVIPNMAPANTLTTYTYTITIQNVGTATLNMRLIRDYLPDGFLYVADSTSGDFTWAEPTATMQQGRQRLDWNFSPEKQLQPGETKTLVFEAQAIAPPGEYYNEAWVTFDEFDDELEDPVYTWPTAGVKVMAVFTTRATDGESTADAEVWIGPNSYIINQFDITR